LANGNSSPAYQTPGDVVIPAVRRHGLPAEPPIVAVALTELSVVTLVNSDDRDRAARSTRPQLAEADFEPLPFDAAC
jgi:hypothetical protein